MPRKGHENDPRPQRKTFAPEVVREKRKAKEALKEMPAHYLETQRNNPDIKACCKDTDNLTYTTMKSDPSQKQANMGVFTCDTCGCRHFRVAQGPGVVTS